MKKQLLRIASLKMALVVLFVSAGWDVKYHYCTVDHELSVSLGETAALCPHCVGHEHEHVYETATAPLNTDDVTHFHAKCCCDDFDGKIQFSDNFVFSSEKHFHTTLPLIAILNFDILNLFLDTQQASQDFTAWKVPYFISGKKLLLLFSSLRLNPLVF